MLLQNKNAVIYGAGGSLGGAVAKALAREGATVFLTGHRLPSVEIVANEIVKAGGNAEIALVDVMDEKAIDQHLAEMIKKSGSIDISFNAAGIDVIQNIPLVEMKMNDFVLPVTLTLQSNFNTATAAGRYMKKQGSGVIISLTATPGGIGYPYTGGFAAACAALESFSRNLASELGVYGVRAVNIRSGGSPDSRIFKEVIDSNPEIMKPVIEGLQADTMLKKLPLMEDIANTALFLSSHMAKKITGVSIDVTSGTTAALNYRVTHKS